MISNLKITNLKILQDGLNKKETNMSGCSNCECDSKTMAIKELLAQAQKGLDTAHKDRDNIEEMIEIYEECVRIAESALRNNI